MSGEKKMLPVIEAEKGFSYCPYCGEKVLHLEDIEKSGDPPDAIYVWFCPLCKNKFKHLVKSGKEGE